MLPWLAPAERNSTDISAASATFCISGWEVVMTRRNLIVGLATRHQLESQASDQLLCTWAMKEVDPAMTCGNNDQSDEGRCWWKLPGNDELSIHSMQSGSSQISQLTLLCCKSKHKLLVTTSSLSSDTWNVNLESRRGWMKNFHWKLSSKVEDGRSI